MKITRVTVLYRHAKTAMAVLNRNKYKHHTLKLRGGVALMRFDFKDVDACEHLFGIPYAIESLTRGHKNALKMSCKINEYGKPCYISNAVLDVEGWVEQENLYRAIEKGRIAKAIRTNYPSRN